MAKGKSTPASFKPGDPRASLAGKKSSRALSEEVKYMRKQTTNDIETCVYKYIYKPIQELKQIYSDPTLGYLDMIIIRTMIKGLEIGDFGHLEPILARSVGKVTDKLQVSGHIETYKEIRVRMENMTEEEATQKYFELLKTVS